MGDFHIPSGVVLNLQGGRGQAAGENHSRMTRVNRCIEYGSDLGQNRRAWLCASGLLGAPRRGMRSDPHEGPVGLFGVPLKTWNRCRCVSVIYKSIILEFL